MAIKKAYIEIIDLLESHLNSKVETVMEAVVALASAKTKGGTAGASSFIKDDEGNVTHVYCYYHKKWESVTECDYGSKANSPTGLNNMCKEGVSMWTKQQRASKKAKEELLNSVASGDILPEDLGKEQEDIESARGVIEPREDGHGSDDKPE